MDEPALVMLAALHVEGVGPGRLAQLRDAFGSVAAGVRAATAGASPPAGMPVEVFRALPRRLDLVAAERHLASVRSSAVEVLCWDDPSYPAPLWMAPHPPPPLLYLQGALPPTFQLSAATVRAAAVVGTRHPTGRGLALARELAASLAALDVAVVSGLALGIDGAAHEGALNAGGPTVAVLGGGHGHLHPPSHRGLAKRILGAGGAILSEYAPDVRPERHAFPERNRLVSGLARLTVVVEAGLRSGTNSTVAHALDQHRDVFAGPGRLGDPTVAGTLRMIRDGAHPLTELEDVLYRFRPGDAGTGRSAAGGPAELLLQALLRVEDATLDELAAVVALPLPMLGARLTALELDGRAVRTAAGRYRLDSRERERRSAELEAEAIARRRTPPRPTGAG